MRIRQDLEQDPEHCQTVQYTTAKYIERHSLSSEQLAISFPSGDHRAQRTQLVCSAKLLVNLVLAREPSVMRKKGGREGGKRSQIPTGTSRTMAIEICLSSNFVVIFDFNVFPFPPSKAHFLSNVPMTVCHLRGPPILSHYINKWQFSGVRNKLTC